MRNSALVGIVTALMSLPVAASQPAIGYPVGATVTGTAEIHDGDTLRLVEDNRHQALRLQGLDAPEADQECSKPDTRRWPCGAAASMALDGLAGGRQVSCQVIDTDKYGRPVVTCHAGDVDVAQWMVQQGWAVSAYGHSYDAAETEARAAKRGIWGGKFELPASYRARMRRLQGERAERDRQAQAAPTLGER